MLDSVSAISCNNDKELGAIIAEAYNKVGKNGVVLMEEGQTEMTLCNTGLRVSQVSPRVPEQASFSTARRQRPRADTAPLEHLDGKVTDDMKRFAWLG